MITRYVFLKLTDEYATPEGRAEVAAKTRAALPALPGVKGVQVGVAADDKSIKSWDISIQVEFDTLADVEAYLPHPDHRDYVDNFLKPKLAVIKAWNFETE